MNREDIIDILTAVQVVDHRTVGEGDITIWGAIIGHLPKDLCLDAVIYHRREKPGVWLEPGHIVARVRAVLRERHERQSLEERQAGQERIDAKLAGRILELAEAKSIPDEELKFRRPAINTRAVACPHCRVGPGQRCYNAATRQPLRVGAHHERIDAATAARNTDSRTTA